MNKEGMETRVLLDGERPGHITTDTPWNSAGIESIMTRDQAFEFVKQARGKTPADWLSWMHLGTAMHVVGETLAGLTASMKALELHRCASTLMNVAVILETLGRFDEALALSKEANALDPTNQFAGLLYAQGLLRQGRWDEGWTPFEWYSWGTIWQGELSEYIKHWEGEDLRGKRILVLQGGGFGDNLMFFRWFKNLRQSGAHITYACPDVMVPLLRGHPWVDRLLPTHEGPETEGLPEVDLTPSEFDYFVPLMGLARRFHATVQSTKRNCETYITVPHETDPLNYAWKKKKPVIGVCWSGAEKLDPRRHRSLDTMQTKKLLTSVDVDWINLQYGVKPPVDIFNVEIYDWSDTAAIVNECDLVVTVDTGVMHLAGAMGKQTWVILPGLSDWKFLLGSDKMPFYPTVRLFRNKGEGLNNALDACIHALRARAGD